MVAGPNVGQEDVIDPSSTKHYDEKYLDLNYFDPVTTSKTELMEAPRPPVHRVSRPNGQEGILHFPKLSDPSQSSESTTIESPQLKLSPQDGHRGVLQASVLCDPEIDMNKNIRFREGNQQGRYRPINNIALAVDDLAIPWSELVLKEKIGAGEC